MSHIIDRRLNGRHKSAVNRQRFLRRYREQIRRAVAQAVDQRSIRDIERGERVHIPTRDVAEPVFQHGRGGVRRAVFTGNREFVVGDRLPKPEGGGRGGTGSRASNEGEGEDAFVFELSREEFLDAFFEDLALPDLVKTQLQRTTRHKWVRAGYTRDGVPANINVRRSLQNALARRIAAGAGWRRRLAELEAELERREAAGDPDAELAGLREEIDALRRRIAAIPYLDEFDLRYNNRIRQPKPITQAVMFCVMDVSGSMTQEKKDIAKRFFILLYLFLTRNYEHIDVVFVRHHTTAKEVDEETFFYSRESGGTVVSSALELVREIAEKRYPLHEWNLYVAQATDGDNWDDDCARCGQLLAESILPMVQYYAYVEISDIEGKHLWREYEALAAAHPKLAMRRIREAREIFPVFHELFRRRPAAAG
ncbi:MAG: UPF0229 protein [Gammaproteobacteria bacterium]|nr:MAG: UPF0229 protein [Gammaproteobacteria bacterium]